MTVSKLPTKAPSARRDPPETLEAPEAELWRSMVAGYRIEDEPGLELLAVYCSNRQLARNCRTAIDTEGLQVLGRAHPLLRVLDAAERRALAALAGLHLDIEPLKAPGRPPGHPGSR